jgi:uncharacterized protein (DUF362 family)
MQDIRDGFVNIATVFDEKAPRTVEGLRHLYDDHELLLSVAEKLAGNILTAEKIADKKLLLKPNWVKQPFRQDDDICLCTHNNFILAVLELVLKRKPAAVLIGDAPIQGCYWERLITKDFTDRLQLLSEKYNIPVTVKDFRRVFFDTVTNKLDDQRNPMSNYIIFDVGKKSYLEPITVPGKKIFRVAQYNPDKFTDTHRPGMHKYCIIKELFNADVVISLPKIKTHQKTGLTGALKNIVGFNGDKDYLPHHRVGGTKMGGDSYPGKNRVRYWAELAMDNANRNMGNILYKIWFKISTSLWALSLPGKEHQWHAAWYGNDTTWRMVMDLNLIINYGREDGTLADTPQRFLYSFCDAVIGGQGDGPLSPDPLNLGVMSFTDDSTANDICMATLMGLPLDKLPLLTAAKSFMPHRKVIISLNGEPVKTDSLRQYAVKANPSPGWQFV